jgi:hypothetical protein
MPMISRQDSSATAPIVAFLAVFAVVGFGLLSAEVATGHSATPNAVPTPNPIFAPLISTLHSKTSVPLLLPTVMPQNDLPIYASIGNATSTAFRVILERSTDCDGAYACQYGRYAGKISSGTPPGVPVQLANGITAYFQAATCGGAGCTASVLAWNVNGYEYSEENKAGQQADMVSEANSVASF